MIIRFKVRQPRFKVGSKEYLPTIPLFLVYVVILGPDHTQFLSLIGGTYMLSYKTSLYTPQQLNSNLENMLQVSCWNVLPCALEHLLPLAVHYMPIEKYVKCMFWCEHTARKYSLFVCLRLLRQVVGKNPGPIAVADDGQLYRVVP